jgi:hypothetical protein
VLNAQHGGWDKQQTEAALQLAGRLYDEKIDLRTLRG